MGFQVSRTIIPETDKLYFTPETSSSHSPDEKCAPELHFLRPQNIRFELARGTKRLKLLHWHFLKRRQVAQVANIPIPFLVDVNVGFDPTSLMEWIDYICISMVNTPMNTGRVNSESDPKTWPSFA